MTDASFWDRHAESYSRRPVANPEAFERKIEHVKSRMTPHSVVLDIGCGTGSLALRLAPHARHVHGLDLSPEMIRIARAKANAAGTSNVTFHTGAFDGALREFAPGSLDGVCAFSLLHLVDDHAAALRQIHSLLKPGGFLVASTVCLGESAIPFRPLLKLMHLLRVAPRVSVMTKSELRRDVQQVGFVEIAEPDVGAKQAISFLMAVKP